MLLLIRCLLLLQLWGLCACFLLCNAILCVLSSFAIISLRKRELVALLYLSSDVPRLLLFCGFSSRCRGLICSARLWYFLIILTYFCNESISFELLQPCSHNVQSKMITCLTPEVEPLKSGDDVAYGIGLDNVYSYEKFSETKTSLKIFSDPNVTVDTRIKFRNSFDQKITIKVSKLFYYNSRNIPHWNSLL